MEKILQAVGDHTKLHEILANYEQFQANPDPRQFALIKVGGALLDDSHQKHLIAKDLAALSQVGLYPTVVHGAGPQLDSRFAELGYSTPKVNGKRSTPKVASETLSDVAYAVSNDFADTIKLYGAKSELIHWIYGVLEGSLEDSEDIASVVQLDVKTGPITHTILNRRIPILSSLGRQIGHSQNGHLPLNINADTAAATIALKLGVNKYISLTETGAVLDANGNQISELHSDEAAKMIASGEIHSGMVPKIEEATALIAQGIGSVAITSPENLLLELFTDAGKGTLIR